MKLFTASNAVKNTTYTVCFNEEEASGPAELRVYSRIGADWDGSGLTASAFLDALDKIPRNRDLHLRINSPGGDVREGFAIKTRLDEWPKKVTCTIDGIAASVASWLPMNCSRISMPKHAQMFIHDAWGVVAGSEADLINAAKDLGKTSDQIAEMYANRCGKSAREMRDIMREGRLLTGTEAKELGLVDEVTEERPIENFSPEIVSRMREQLQALNQLRTPHQGSGQQEPKAMDKAKLMALLTKHGVAVNDSMTVEQLQAALEKLVTQNAAPTPPPAPSPATPAPVNDTALAAVTAKLQVLTNALEESKREREAQAKDAWTKEVDDMISNDQLPANQRQSVIDRAWNDKELQNTFRALPSRPPGVPGLGPVVAIKDESLESIGKYCRANGPEFMRNFIGRDGASRHPGKLGEQVMKDIGDHVNAVANVISRHRDKLIAAWNTNTVDSNLKRNIIMRDVLTAFAKRLLPFQSFAKVFQNVPLEGPDASVIIPYYPLQNQSASTSWSPSTAYTAGNTTVSYRSVAVGGSGTDSGSSATTGTMKDRLYQGISIQSVEWDRLPYVDWAKLFAMKGAQLGIDVFTAVVSRVITAANYGSTLKALAPATFVADDLVDFKIALDNLNWPDMGRGIALASDYQTLLKDEVFKMFYGAGTSTIRESGKIPPSYGFERLDFIPNLDDYTATGEGCVGWVCVPSAVLVATAPVVPTESVRAALEVYEIITDPETGATFEHRRWGDPDYDKTQEFIEVSLGAAKGDEAGLKRLTTA